MTDIFWLGGSPCCGKSSVSEILRDRFALNYYKCDDHFDEHLKLAAADGKPTCSIISKSTHEYVFMRSHEEHVALAFDVFGEEFDYVLRDVERAPKPLLAEGAVLLPDSLSAAGVPASKAFYMLPTEEFFRREYKKREWAWDRLQETSDPEEAFENWMRRDVEFARRVARMAGHHGYVFMRVDGARTIEENAAAVARHFGLT